MSYLRYLCLVAYSGVQHWCVVFLFCLSSYVAGFSGFSIFVCRFSILLCLFSTWCYGVRLRVIDLCYSEYKISHSLSI